jgi:hypothetical protein
MSMVILLNGALTSYWCISLGFQVMGLCRCCTTGTISRHNFLPGARPHLSSCCHPNDLMTCVNRSTSNSLCSEGILSRLFFIILQRNPNDVLIYNSLQQEISMGFSNLLHGAPVGHIFPSWLLSALYFLQHGSCPGHTFLHPLKQPSSGSLQLEPQLLIPSWHLHLDSAYTLLSMGVNIVVFVIGHAQIWSCTVCRHWIHKVYRGS